MFYETPAEDCLYDLAIIGGGITGAAVARDAALRGLKVVLFEKDDFGSGASSKTSKLAHGGLRYLEYGEIGLVRESLRERNLLLSLCPEYVHPRPFVFPVYRSSRRPLWQIDLGIRLYRWLSKASGGPDAHMLSPTEASQRFPQLAPAGLLGAPLYQDAQMQDGRLVIENILSAEHYGASVHNYMDVLGLESSKENRHRICVRSSVGDHHVDARCVINATGAWSNFTLRRMGIERAFTAPTKGIHVVLPDMGLDAALILQTAQDGRVFFVIPWEDRTLVGTTDTFHPGTPDGIAATEEEMAYLLAAVNERLPALHYELGDIITTFAGLRPLLAAKPGHSASRVSRRHKITLHAPGILSVAGGKFTTYRAIAEEVVTRAVQVIGSRRPFAPCRTHRLPLTETSLTDTLGRELEKLQSGAQISEGCRARLVHDYGPRVATLFQMLRSTPDLTEPICEDEPYLKAELQYVVQHEKVLRLEDWLERRTSIGLRSRLSSEFKTRAAALLEEMVCRACGKAGAS